MYTEDWKVYSSHEQMYNNIIIYVLRRFMYIIMYNFVYEIHDETSENIN